MSQVLTPALAAQIYECDISLAEQIFDELVIGMTKFNILTPAQIRIFFAQTKWESGGLNYFAELGPVDYFLKYDPTGPDQTLASDLGNTQPGDGYEFRGSGPIQVTGRSNFEQAQSAMRQLGVLGPDGNPLDITSLPNTANVGPDLARTHKYGFLLSCWWWEAHSCNVYAMVQPESEANILCGREINRGDAYSQYQAQNEADRIAAYQHVLQFGDITLPGVPAPKPPTPADWFDMANEQDLKNAIVAAIPQIAQAVKVLLLNDTQVGLRVQNLVWYRHIPADTKDAHGKVVVGSHADGLLLEIAEKLGVRH